MMDHLFSYNDLIEFVRTTVMPHNKLRGVNPSETMYPDKGLFACLQNQFFHIVLFPDFKLDYISPSVYQVLGYHPEEMTLRLYYQKIHNEDRAVVLLAVKKMIELSAPIIDKITPLQTIFSLAFRMYHKDGRILRLLNHNCIYKKAKDNSLWKGLCVSTDITNISSSSKVELGVMNYGDQVEMEFPDKEITNLARLFTPREREILALLVAGKSSCETGDLLCISRHTVDTHRRHMLAKSHLCNTAELVAFSLQNNLTE